MLRLALCLVLASLGAAPGAWAQIISSDGSDLCNANQAQCRSKCLPPQTYAFACNQGDNFNKPTVNCQCVTPATDNWDGSAVLKMVQAPPAGACTTTDAWLESCASELSVVISMNSLTAGAPSTMGAATNDGGMAAAQIAGMMGGAPPTNPANSGVGMPSAAMGGMGGMAAPAPLVGPANVGLGGLAAAPSLPGTTAAGGALGLGGLAPPALAPAPLFPTLAPTAPLLPSLAPAAPIIPTLAPAAKAVAAPVAAATGVVLPGALPAAAATTTGAATGGGSAAFLTGRRLAQVNIDTSVVKPLRAGVACNQPMQGIVTGVDSAFLAIPGGSVGQAKVQPNNVIVISAGTGGQCAAAYQLQTGQFLRAGRNLTAIEEAKNASMVAAQKAAQEAVMPAAAGSRVASALAAAGALLMGSLMVALL